MRIIRHYYFFLFLCFPFELAAQLWNGNLGAPIMNIDFGAGRSMPLPPTTTSYLFAKGCPPPGGYSIEHFLFGCAANTWVSLIGDHTGGIDGNYMLVNGASYEGDVLVKNITGLCGNTTYEFSGWVINAMQSIACGGNPKLPNLTFSIETIAGSVLASINTGDIPVTELKTWRKYGIYYTTPVIPISLVLRIKSNAVDGCGSVFMMDDIALKPAGPAITITLNGGDVSIIDICRGYTDTFILHASYTSGYNDPVLQWQKSVDTGKTWLDIRGETTATFLIPHRDDSLILYHLKLAERTNISNPNCSIYSDRIWTNVKHLRDPYPLKQLLGCLNKNLEMISESGYLTYQWTGPNGFKSSEKNPVLPNLQYNDAGLYTVLLYDADTDCTVQDSFQVNIFPSTTISTKNLYNICEGETVNLSATGDGTYDWTPATGLSNTSIPNPVAMPHDSIEYKVVLTNSYGCKDSANVVINVFKNLEITAGSDKKILNGDTVLLDGVVKGTAVNYYWSSSATMDNASAIRPHVFPAIETQYTLNAVSTVGCGNAASSTVTVRVYPDLLVPTAFSPNGDGLNDVYHILELDSYKLVAFSIFNRWGVKVFSTTNANIGWDGRVKGNPQDAGAYMYFLEMKNASGKIISRKGSIMLLK